ncbi:MAG: reductive dehalogenase domain-containing protein [Chloroflexota bacterium]|jgi:NAD-dependent dihydropyrimidine dehydrogenase PreA subunit
MMIIDRIFKRILPGGEKGPSLDAMLAEFDKELANFDRLVRPSPESKPRTSFDSPDLPVEAGRFATMNGRQALKVLPVMLPLIRNMRQSASYYDGQFKARRDTADPAFIAELEKMAFKSGASDIHYVKVPRHAIFRDKGIPHEYAIVFTVEMNMEKLKSAPSFECFVEVARGYRNLAVIGNKLARFMHKNGFAAYPGTALGGITDYVYLAELAGLGASGYHGLLIGPEEGARLRINTIYTNIKNLPLNDKNEHLWVRDFCAMCKKCIRECPVGAIFDQPVSRGDGGMQCIDHGPCRDYFNQHYGCAICLVECPFSQAGYHKIKARFKGNPGAPHFLIPEMPMPESRQAPELTWYS